MAEIKQNMTIKSFNFGCWHFMQLFLKDYNIWCIEH